MKSDLWEYLGGDKGDWGDIEDIKKSDVQEPFSDLAFNSGHPPQAKQPAEDIFKSMDAFEAGETSSKLAKEDPFKSFGL